MCKTFGLEVLKFMSLLNQLRTHHLSFSVLFVDTDFDHGLSFLLSLLLQCPPLIWRHPLVEKSRPDPGIL